ncbi:MAG: Bifunctional protein GlmU [candidate division TM6 bacterium GW2011_GWE2_41_16]|nr:MAG: Bifunctional protein GlmU [candidate division TM6 bacterium GW2011_GWE2_41_16]
MASFNASVQGIILAAGRSTRFKTEGTKLQYTLCGQEMIMFPVKLLNQLDIPTTIVVGHKKELVMSIVNGHNLSGISFIEQKEQQGTGHALKVTQSAWSADHILVINGDMPLVTRDTIENLIQTHLEAFADVSFVKAHNQDPTIRGYGRVIRKGSSVIVKEEKDLPVDAPIICCVNAGIYIFKRSFLEKGIDRLTPSTVTGEWYIPDLINFANDNRYHVETIDAAFDLIRGVNTLKELWEAEYLKRTELISYWMSNGVQFSVAPHIQLDIDVTIGSGTIVGPGALIKKGSRIGRNCRIEAYTSITASTIEENVTILPFSVINESHVAAEAIIGPFAHLRNNVTVGAHSHIGSFVEATKTTIGEYSKAKHLAYLGNAHIGSHVNIGAGTIVCNYNGVNKSETIIKDGAQIGALNALIAPISIGQEAITAAGSSLTENVPDNGFAIARTQQTTKHAYAPILREKLKNKKNLDEVLQKTTSVSPAPAPKVTYEAKPAYKKTNSEL